MRTRWIGTWAMLGSVACGGGGIGSAQCVELPATVEEDLAVGPGCVHLDRTVIDNDAELTIEPGTEIRVARGGYLSVSRFLTAPGDGGRLIAEGTEEEPIVFTSVEEQRGDWGCVFLGSDAIGSVLRHVVVEYAGAQCGATGAGFTAGVVVGGAIDEVRSVEARHNAGHGVLLLDAHVREFDDIGFADNDLASLALDANRIVVPGPNLRFDDVDDYIEVFASNMDTDGTIAAQMVPYRFLGGATVGTSGAQPVIVASAGVRFELDGVNFAVEGGNLVVDGRPDDPVVFASSRETPAGGDWGCLWFRHGGASSQTTGVPTLRNAVIAHAGGEGCGNNNNYGAAVVLTPDAILDNVTFDTIDGHGIIVPLDACPANACDQTFIDVTESELSCDGEDVAC